MHHALGALSFTPPPGWADATIVAFVAPSSDPRFTANVTIAREARRGTETLKTHVHRYLIGLAATLPTFDMREMIDVQVAGRPAVRLRGEWTTAEGAVYEQTSVHLMPDAHETTVTTVTVTSSLAASQAAAQALAGVLASAHVAGSAPRIAAATPAPPRTPPPPAWDDVERAWR